MDLIQKLFYFIVFSICVHASTQAQNISIYEAPEVRSVMDRYASNNRIHEMIPGFRIQLLSTSDRRKMEKTREEFMSTFPYMLLDFEHTPPHYKLRTGAFQTKLEAMRILYIVNQEIPGAYITKDRVSRRELIN